MISSLRAIQWASLSLGLILMGSSIAGAQDMGGIRGTVYDRDFEDSPLPNVQVLISETGATTLTNPEGNYVFGEIAPGNYTLVFSKDGFTRQFTPNVIVVGGRLTEVNISMPGEFTEMEEFVVQDLDLGGSSELGMLNLRVESPALMSAISSEMISQSGEGDAAGALKLVAGATVQDGKYAVVRGLPDRYVNSQLNGVRLPTADADKRAVELDQFPSAVVESIQVSKTFTPDQQGDASGGAVNVVTKGIPEEMTFNLSTQIGYNSQVSGRSDFLTYEGGGVSYWGFDDGRRDIQYNNLGSNWNGAVGVTRDKAPVDYKWGLSGGGKHEFSNGIKLGGFGSLFYERDSSFSDDGFSDQYWAEGRGAPLTPQYDQGAPSQGSFLTKLFDVTRGSQEVKWGTLGTVGVETQDNNLSLLYMYTHAAEDVAILGEDTRGKAYYFPGYDPSDPLDDGNLQSDAAPYLRTETLEYTERTTQTFQISGAHTLVFVPEFQWNRFKFQNPALDWGLALSSAGMNQPDKRQFGSLYSTDLWAQTEFKPAANFTIGNLQRIWKEISEDSVQGRVNAKLPFTQWNEREGYLKLGLFNDRVKREYNQDSFSNFGDNGGLYYADWKEHWSRVFPSEDHPISDGSPYIDVDYDGEQTITAVYGTLDLPVSATVNIIGGARWEKTELDIINYPEADATWIPPGSSTSTKLKTGDADVSFRQNDLLPSLGFVYAPWESITLRGTYSETIARQTFKELTPIQQMEFLGGDVFVGNPALEMSALKNYDLRFDYTPYAGGLVSVSAFYKDIKKPIEYVQRVADSVFTTAVNYPEGWLRGIELEVRQQIGHFWERVEGLSVGANVTLIQSQVTLPADEAAKVRVTTRDMTAAPDYLYNIFLTHELKDWGTKFGFFYTVKGDTLIAGLGQSNGKDVPSVYAREYGSLNLSVSQKLNKQWNLKFQAKNLTNPRIEEYYKYGPGNQTKTSYRRGIDLTLSMDYSF